MVWFHCTSLFSAPSVHTPSSYLYISLPLLLLSSFPSLLWPWWQGRHLRCPLWKGVVKFPSKQHFFPYTRKVLFINVPSQMSLQYQAPPSQVIRREKETLRWCSEARPEPRLVSSGREGKRAKLFRISTHLQCRHHAPPIHDAASGSWPSLSLCF